MCNDCLVFAASPARVELEAGKSYFICACGRSKDGVFCDGSHKGTDCSPVKLTVNDTKAYTICRCKASASFPFCDGTHSKLKDQVGKHPQL
ncbi:MAG: CDGSH iron-sulfur domain-containing protein [Sulfurimonas sp.]|nr:CDGSH iron-sulfur domain-containing protein [Sulfurimonadaceae bacterium]